ncbi:MAG TPA: dienelactone hydrolase family protein [Burkholderiales bacterium]|nr:dienelactone hydrolase family protein [Burkholderiales bacterium]
MLKHLAFVALSFWALSAAAAVREEAVAYKDGETTMRGFVVYDDAQKGRRPGILVVHEWWGITEHTRDAARDLAAKGYTAFVVDMYGEGRTAEDPKSAGQLAGSVRKNAAVQLSRFNAAREQLAKHPTVDPKRIGAIGFCFGGSVALDMARAGVDLAAVAAFHAGLGTQQPAQAGKVRAQVLVLNGADDPLVPREQVEGFKKEMEAAKVTYRLVDYPGAVHAFTNPRATEAGKKFNMPIAYHAKADRQSKAEMDKFFARVFGKK